MKFLYRNIYQCGRLFWRGASHSSFKQAQAWATRHSKQTWLGVETIVESPDHRFPTTVVFFQRVKGPGKLSEKQERILRHLVKRGHAMNGHVLCNELGMIYIGADTFASLMAKGYTRLTDQGYIATEAGRLRVTDVGKVDVVRLREAFQKKAEHHCALMSDADAVSQTKVFRAHAAISSGYFRAVRILGGPPRVV